MSGQNLITMEELSAHFNQLPGVQHISTYIQSGNVFFETKEQDEALLQKALETHLETKMGYKVTAILRKFEQLQDIVKNNPFDTIKTEDRAKLYVTFLSDLPAYDVRGSLGVYSNDAEYARVVGREVYIFTGNYGKTCFSNSFIEKKLKVAATTRNWTTVNKMLDL